MPRKPAAADHPDETPDASVAATRPLPPAAADEATTILALESTADPVASPDVAPDPAPSRTPGSRVLPFVLGAAAVILVILLAGGTSWVVARAAAAQPMPVASAAPQKAAGGQGATGARHRAAVVRGTVQSMNATTWTIATMAQGTVTVAVTDRTRYLDDGSPSSTAAFHVGDTVIAAGTRSGGTLTAVRIVHRTAAPTS